MKYLLFYDYVENMLERRTPYREAHLALATSYVERGTLQMAGAFAEPTDGAVFVFTDRAAAEAFPTEDPYVKAGLVPSWKVRDWNVVIGG